MKVGLPGPVRELLNSWAVRFFALCLIWGVGAFVWGSLDALGKVHAARKTEELLAPYSTEAEVWLKDVLRPVEKLADDERLRIALDLPDGVKSVAALRVLYEYSYTYRASDVYLVDLGNETVGMTASSAPLRPEVIAAVTKWRGSGQTLIGAGERNGVLYLARKVQAPSPHEVYALVPITLSKAAMGRPTIAGDGENAPGLLVTHTTGQAWWNWQNEKFTLFDGGVYRTRGNGLISDEKAGAYVLVQVRGAEAVWLGMYKADLATGGSTISKAVVALWVLILSIAIFWQQTAGFRSRVSAKSGPVGRALQGVGRTMRPLGMVMFQMGERLRREIDSPLVGAPGDFTPTDFVGSRHADNRGGLLSSATTASKRKDLLARKSAEHTASTDVAVAIAAERDQAERDRNMKEIIRTCLREGRVNLLYQPIFDTATNLPAKHEVYARLVLPDGEILAPGQFLPIAEKFGLTLALDGVVLRRVMATHFGQGVAPTTQFALNVGGTSLDGITYLQELLSYGSNVLEHLVFEVRSQEIVRDARALKLLKDIQKHGGYLAVDYFGGGTAMLQASKAMGFDYVKLDASRFTANDDGKKELLRLCLTAKEISLPVVLEKVEDAEIETFARKAGVNFLQGYGLAKPSAEVSTAPLTRNAANTPQVAAPSTPTTGPTGA